MANNENLVQYSGRSRKEVEEINRKGGQHPKARRRKAEFRKTLNALLTAEIDNPEWKPFLESIGLDCTLESAMLAAQIREAMQGNTKAAYFVAQYAGQNGAAEEDIRNKEADTELKKARKQAVTGENETDEALEKLDAILKEVRDNAVEQNAE